MSVLRRLMLWIVGLAVVAVVAGAAYVRLTPPPAAEDALTVIPRSTPNWALAAPKEVRVAGVPTREGPIYATGPDELLGHLDAVAAAESGVETLAPPSGGASRAYVQRSALLGYPDIISAAVVDLGSGDAGRRTGVVLYSRSVYGHSDLGVNAARLERWIAALDARVDRVR